MRYLLDVFVLFILASQTSAVITFEKWFGGTKTDRGYSVAQTTDVGYIIAGVTTSFGAGNFDVYLIKTDQNGDTIWTKTYGGAGTDYGYSVAQTTDEGYIITGRTSSYGAGADVYLIKTNSSGDILWTKTFGGTGLDEGDFVQQTTDGGYIIAGGTKSYGYGDNEYDVYLIKTDQNGDTLWTKTYGGTDTDWGISVAQTTDGGYIITGYTKSYGAGGDVYLIKTDGNGNVYGIEESQKVQKSKSPKVLEIYPNPFSSVASIKYSVVSKRYISLKIYDVTGRLVKTLANGEEKSGYYNISFNAKGLPTGVYFAKFVAGNYKATKKLILVR